MQITKDSRIVEVFSNDLLNKTEDVNELQAAHGYIRELASNPTPNNRYEIGQIMSYVIDTHLENNINYLELIADVKQVAQGEKAQFQIDMDGLKAFWQAKSASTERSQVSSKFVTLDTDEISIRPQVNFHDIATGKADLVKLAEQASNKIEIAIAKRIQDVVYAAFSDMSLPNFAAGAGVTKADFNPLLHAMRRAGGGASVVGDVEALTQFTELTGFNGGNVPESLAIEHNQNGLIGHYLGAPLVQLENPFQAGSLTETELRKDLVYVVPNGDVELRPVKIVLEGDTMSGDAVYDINSKITEFRFDKWVGVGIVGAPNLLSVYEDTKLS